MGEAVAEAVGRQTGEGARYDAFISYSHAADGKLAPAVQEGLQHLARPFLKPRALRIFRDKTSLSASPHLWGSIEEALLDSRYFILLASPEAATSTWVSQELSAWISSRSPEKILIALTDGDLAWDSKANDFDRLSSAALPPSLQDTFAEEPLYVDLRWARSETDLSLRHSRFRDAIADLAAPIHGIGKEELEGEDVRQHRRTRRFVRLAVGALILLTTLAVLLAVFAVLQRGEALRQASLATSRQLAAQAGPILDERLDLGALLAVQAARTAPTFEANSAMLSAVQRTANLVRAVHTGHLFTRAAYSADGGTLVTARPDGPAAVWNADTGEAVGELLSDHGAAFSVAFCESGGEVIVTGNLDGTVSLWDPATLKEIDTLRGLPEPVYSMACAGTFLVTGYDGRVVTWDLEEGDRRPIRLLKVGGGLAVVAVAPGSPVIAIGTADGVVRTYNFTVQDATPTKLGKLDGRVLTLALGPGGDELVGGTSGELAWWDLRKTKPVEQQVHSQYFGFQGIDSVVYTPDGSTVLAGTSLGNILRFDAATHLLIGPPIPGHRRAIGGLAMRTDGGGFASVGLDGAILEWDLSGPTALARPLVIAPAPMTSLAYSRDGSVLATGLADGTIHMWGADTGSPLGALDGDGSVVQSVTFGEAETIASGTEDGSVFLWQKDGGSSARTQLAKGGAQVSAVAFDREGDTLAAASSDGTIHLWNTATGEASGSALDAGLGPVAGVAFSPDGETLAAATEGAGETGNGGGVILWNLHTLTERRTLTYGGGDPVSVAISPDGRVLAVGTFDGAVVLWDMRTLQRIGQPLTAQSKWITTVAFSPDGRTLASGSWDGTVALWDVVARRLLGQPLGVRDNTIVRTVAFRPPVGNTLASVGGETMTIGLAISGGMPGVVWAWSDVLWSSDSRSLIDRLCGVAGRNMSASEWAEYLPGRPYSKTCALKPEGD